MSQSYANTSEPFKIALPSFPPFYFEPQNALDNQPQRKGSIILYIELLQAKFSQKIEVVHIPYARIPISLANGEIDGAIMFKNPSIEETVDYLGPISLSQVILVPRSNVSVDSYENLNNLSFIAVIRGARFETRFDEDIKINKYYVRDYKQALNMFALSRADAVIGGLEGLDYNLKMTNLSEDDLGEPVVMNDKQIWLHVSKHSEYIKHAKELNDIIRELYQPYLFNQLYQSEFEPGESLFFDGLKLIK